VSPYWRAAWQLQHTEPFLGKGPAQIAAECNAIAALLKIVTVTK
jgi:hypothetical protein